VFRPLAVGRRDEVEMGEMRRSDASGRRILLALAVVGALASSVGVASAAALRHERLAIAKADGEDIGFSLQTEVDCDPLPRVGRVKCVVRLRPVGGTLHFSDAIVLGAPDFAPPVRDRVAFREAQRSDGTGADLPLALSAIGDGDGELYVMGRATVCGERGCRPVQSAASARVVVGASSSAQK
jgi:hypothetical protein